MPDPNEFNIDPYRRDSANGKSPIEKFKSIFTGGLRPNKYKVEFIGNDRITTFDLWEKMSLLCKGSVYNFYTYDKYEVFHNNTTMESVNKINFEPVILRWYVDKKSDVLKVLQNWKKVMYDDDTGMFGYRDDYVINIDVTLLDENLLDVNSVRYNNAFPISVDAIELGWDAVDTLMEVNVTFAYDFPTYTF
jgi:hypothetical protein